MGNNILASIPTYTADGYGGDGGDRLCTFSAGGPPTDGSVGMAFIVLDIAGVAYAAGDFGSPTQRLVVYSNTSVGKASATGLSDDGEYLLVDNFSFVAFANAAG